jgi:hypothetical protein
MKVLFIKVILLGILTAFSAIIIEEILATWAQIYLSQEIILDYYKNFTWFLLAAVLIEEGLKYGAIRYIIFERFAARGKALIASSFLLGIFFGAAEVGLIIYSNFEAKNLLNMLDREIVISLFGVAMIQTSTALLMGSLLLTKEEITPVSFISILSFPVIIHLLYNFLVIQKSNFTNFLVIFTLILSFFISIIILAANYRRLAK